VKKVKEGIKVIVVYADGKMKKGVVYSLPSTSDSSFWFIPDEPVKEERRRLVSLYAVKELIVEK